MSETETQYLISPSPHVHSGDSVRQIMLTVILALLPAMAAGVILFGANAVRVTAVCVVTCVASEYIARRIMKRNAGIDDLSAVVTGILLAFNLPPGIPSWMAAVGAVAAIVIGKQIYGGIGYNLFNPALIGRTILLISFPVAMTTWLAPGGFTAVDANTAVTPAAMAADAITTATPLGEWKTAWSAGSAPLNYFINYTPLQLFIGLRGGCIGETSALALILGAVILFWRRCITWHAPAAFIGGVAVFAWILYRADPTHNLPPLYHVLSGGLFLGALFMATDMVTTPVTRSGMFIFGLGCAILTMIIRRWGGYPEGVSFSILIMNALTPLINRATRPRVFGHPKSGGRE